MVSFDNFSIIAFIIEVYITGLTSIISSYFKLAGVLFMILKEELEFECFDSFNISDFNISLGCLTSIRTADFEGGIGDQALLKSNYSCEAKSSLKCAKKKERKKEGMA